MSEIKPLTPFPARSWFMTAGIGLAEVLKIERRWQVLTEEERQQVVRRVLPLRNVPLDELLK